MKDIATTATLSEAAVNASYRCRTVDNEAAPAMDIVADSHDFDQLLCQLSSCVLDDDIAVFLALAYAGDPRAAICAFERGRFFDGVATVAGQAVYVAMRGDGVSSASAQGLAPVSGVSTTSTLCIRTDTIETTASCGTYQTTSDENLEGRITGLRVTATWFSEHEPTAGIAGSHDLFSPCAPEITWMTWQQDLGDADTMSSRSLDAARTQPSALGASQVEVIAEDMERWAALHRDSTSLTSTACIALADMSQVQDLHARLEQELIEVGPSADAPVEMTSLVSQYQRVLSDRLALVDADADPLVFSALSDLWSTAHVHWPMIATSTGEQVAGMTLEERIGRVLTADDALEHQSNTIHHLGEVAAAGCAR